MPKLKNRAVARTGGRSAPGADDHLRGGGGSHWTLNASKHFRQRRRRVPPVVPDGASSGLWFDVWKGRAPPPGWYADARRAREVATPRTWLLSWGWRRIGLIDPAEVLCGAGDRGHIRRTRAPALVA